MLSYFFSPIRWMVMDKVNRRIKRAEAEYRKEKLDLRAQYKKSVALLLESKVAEIVKNLF